MTDFHETQFEHYVTEDLEHGFCVVTFMIVLMVLKHMKY